MVKTQLVDYEVSEGIATLTLNDPPLNAYTHEMMKDLDEAILNARFDNEVHAIILTGAGETAFCSGANIRMLSEVDKTFKYYFSLHANETLCRLEQTPKLIVAAINGHCLGGGLEIALACDLRVAHIQEGKTAKFGLPEVNLGIMPNTGGTQRLARMIGSARAMQLLVEGETFSAERAMELALIHKTIQAESRDMFLEEVRCYVQRFTPPLKASRAVGAIKRAVQSGLSASLDVGLALEREFQTDLYASSDASEGLLAFLQKRTPSFDGR